MIWCDVIDVNYMYVFRFIILILYFVIIEEFKVVDFKLFWFMISCLL